MKKETLNFIQKYHMAEQGDGVIAGLSGGADSVCLLRILRCLRQELGIELRAVHVHHGLRGSEADRDAAFSEELCKELDIPFKTVRINAAEEAREAGISVEDAGRRARYRILEAEALLWEKDGRNHVHIATAHHGNDSAETILHNLFRGSGLKGLSGIPPVRGRIIRPILWAQRREILDWLRAHGYPYVEDSTNSGTDYTRNLIRNELLPVITSRINGQAVQNILRAGEHICEADRYLEKTAGEWVRQHAAAAAAGNAGTENGKETAVFMAAELLKEDRIIRRYAVRIILRELGCPLKDITARHIDNVLELLGKGTGKEVNLPYGMTAGIEYGRLIFSRGKEAYAMPDSIAGPERSGERAAARLDFQVFPRQNQQEIPKNQYTKWFDYDKIKDTLSVRNRQTGDYITLASGGRKSVKSFMIDEKIPRESRDAVLLLAEGSHVLWIVGYRISEYYKVTEQTKNILQVQTDGGTDSGR